MNNKFNLSLYRDKCVYNFEVVPNRIISPKHPDNRAGGLMISALPAGEDGHYIPDKKVLFFCGINDLLQLGNLFKTTDSTEIKLFHKPEGDKANPISKTLKLARTGPTSYSISLYMSNRDDKELGILVPGTSFDRGTLWAIEVLAQEAVKVACAFNYEHLRG